MRATAEQLGERLATAQQNQDVMKAAVDQALREVQTRGREVVFRPGDVVAVGMLTWDGELAGPVVRARVVVTAAMLNWVVVQGVAEGLDYHSDAADVASVLTSTGWFEATDEKRLSLSFDTSSWSLG